MDNQLQSHLLKASIQMEVEELLEGKSEEFKEAFYLGLQYGVEIQKAFLDLYFGKSGRNS